jgi:uncharacterized iron-regulated membrane protein
MGAAAKGMRRILFNLHLYVALAAAAFVIIFGVTGSIMAFEQEIDRLLHSKLAYVPPQPPAHSLAEIGAAVAKAYPGAPILGYQFAPSPELSWLVSVRGKGIYVNQYTGEILGERPAGMDFLTYVHQLHLRLALMDKGYHGKEIMSWAALAMLFLLLSGVYLWWPLKHVKIQFGASLRRVSSDVHHAVGIVSFVFLVILTVTGLMIGFDEQTVPMFYRITGSEPARPPIPPVTQPQGATQIGPDQAVEFARAAIPGATPFQINVPGPKGIYFVHSRFPEDLTPAGRSQVHLDPYTGQVLFTQNSRTAPGGTRMVITNRAIHTGDIFGVPTKVLMSLASLMAVVQVISGLTMWWKRTRTRRASSADTIALGGMNVNR